MTTFTKVRTNVNGADYEREIEPRMLLVHFLREELQLTGTHIGCEEGKCGACTVLVNGQSVKSCLMFAVQANGAEVVTIEGLSKNGKLHPVQEAYWENHALQCGYCTPGLIISSLQLLKDNPNPSDEEIRKGISGNICRCTGYVNIFRAIKSAAQKMKPAPVTARGKKLGKRT